MIGIIVSGLIINLAVEPLHAASHGMRIVNIDVVILPIGWLLNKRLLDLDPCMVVDVPLGPEMKTNTR